MLDEMKFRSVRELLHFFEDQWEGEDVRKGFPMTPGQKKSRPLTQVATAEMQIQVSGAPVGGKKIHTPIYAAPRWRDG
jgi:hypothetical protein